MQRRIGQILHSNNPGEYAEGPWRHRAQVRLARRTAPLQFRKSGGDSRDVPSPQTPLLHRTQRVGESGPFRHPCGVGTREFGAHHVSSDPTNPRGEADGCHVGMFARDRCGVGPFRGSDISYLSADPRSSMQHPPDAVSMPGRNRRQRRHRLLAGCGDGGLRLQLSCCNRVHIPARRVQVGHNRTWVPPYLFTTNASEADFRRCMLPLDVPLPDGRRIQFEKLKRSHFDRVKASGG